MFFHVSFYVCSRCRVRRSPSSGAWPSLRTSLRLVRRATSLTATRKMSRYSPRSTTRRCLTTSSGRCDVHDTKCVKLSKIQSFQPSRLLRERGVASKQHLWSPTAGIRLLMDVTCHILQYILCVRVQGIFTAMLILIADLRCVKYCNCTQKARRQFFVLSSRTTLPFFIFLALKRPTPKNDTE